MKVKIVSELISVITIGTLIGLHEHGIKMKWHRLGREAWLSDRSLYFDKFVANPAVAMHSIVIFVVLALLAFAIYKCLALAIAKVLSLITEKKAIVQ